MEPGLWSLLPLTVALVFAFVTRSAIPALLAGVLVGAFMLPGNPLTAMNDTLQTALGTGDFIWICQIVMSIGILTELFKQSGAISGFTTKLSGFASSPRSVGLTTWGLGLAIIDDYFSPLLVGTIMRPLADRARMSREKFAYLLDAMTSPVCVLMPFLAYGAYLAGLVAAETGQTAAEGTALYIRSLPYNWYSLLTVAMAAFVAMRWLPDFGPMRRAEMRVQSGGPLIRPGGSAALADSEEMGEPLTSWPQLILHLFTPIALVLALALGGFLVTGSILIAEAFLAATAFALFAAALGRRIEGGLQGLVDVAMKGIRSVLPALLIIALAYALNTVTDGLGAAVYLVDQSRAFLTPGLLVAGTFVLGAAVSFSTGTSWGTFALLMPLALPLALALSNGPADPLVLKTIAAVTGGGVFGDHTSPVSDTSVLSSAGAGSDHMDHVITQLPYALLVAAITMVLYFLF